MRLTAKTNKVIRLYCSFIIKHADTKTSETGKETPNFLHTTASMLRFSYIQEGSDNIISKFIVFLVKCRSKISKQNSSIQGIFQIL